MSKAWIREYQRERAAKRGEAGICRSCSLPVLPGRSRCAEHQRKQNEYNRAYREARSNPLDNRWSPTDHKLAELGRCKCGLLLPCHGCGPTIIELAGSRRGGE